MNDTIKFANDNQGFIMAVLTFIYVIATVILVYLSHRQVKRADVLERNRVRPFVIFDLKPSRFCVFASVRNVGQTPALNMRIKIDPNLKCVLGPNDLDEPNSETREIAFIQKGVLMIAPQAEIVGFVGSWVRVKATWPSLRFDGRLTYDAPDGTHYSDQVVVDLSAHDGLVHMGEKTIQDVANHLENIAKTIDGIARGCKEPVVRIISDSDYRARQAEFVEELKRTHAAMRDPVPSTTPSHDVSQK